MSDLVREWMHARLVPLGYARRGGTWRRPGDGVVSVVNVQPSVYGGRRFVNLAVWLQELGTRDHPPEHECHLRMRWGSLLSEDRERELARALDGNSNLSDASRQVELELLAWGTLDVFLKRTRTFEEVSRLAQEGFFSGALIAVRAQELLEKAS